jgi:nucleoside-diphosphate-sugar epimerase
MDVSKLHGLGWKAKIPLQQGIENVYRDAFFKEQEINSN